MDDWIPTNTGNAIAGGDGAFERFITAAVAAIITIMFSWRLLAEQGDGSEEGAVGGGFEIENAKVHVREGLVKELSRYKHQPNQNKHVPSSSVDMVESCTNELDIREEKGENMEVETEETTLQDISLDEYRISQSLTQETLNLKKWPSIETGDFDSGFDSNRWAPHSDEELSPIQTSNEAEQPNSAFRNFLDDEFNPFNPFDPFGNSDPFDDNVEPRVLDSDEEMYCCNMLETIIEEDSDEMPSSESDNDSLRRFNPDKYKTDVMVSSESDSDSLKLFDVESDNGSLRRYVTRKLECDEMLDAVVPEHSTNVFDDSDEEGDAEDESGSSTSHVTLFTRETVSIQDSEGNVERTNVVHKINVPLSGDLTIQQLMARASSYPIEPPSDENNSSESDESIVTVLTRQNSTSTIDSNGSPKMIENVTNNSVSSAFPAFTPGNHGDQYRPNENIGTRQIDAGIYSSIKTQPAHYNNNTCTVTSTQFVHIPSNSSWVTDRNNTPGEISSIEDITNINSSVSPVTVNVDSTVDYNKPTGHVYLNKGHESISVLRKNNDSSNHDLQSGNYTSRAAELITQHKSSLEKALQNLPISRLTAINAPKSNQEQPDNAAFGDNNIGNYAPGNNCVDTESTRTNNNTIVHSVDSGVLDDYSHRDKHKSPIDCISDINVNSDRLPTSDSVHQSDVINLAENQSELNSINRLRETTSVIDKTSENNQGIKYIDAQTSTAVRDSPQGFTFVTSKSKFIDYQQTNYILHRDPDDIQSVDDNLENKHTPVPRKRLSIDAKTKVDISSENDQPIAKVKKRNDETINPKFPLKVILPRETDIELDNNTHPDVNALIKQELLHNRNSYRVQSDVDDSEEIVNRSFDDDDFENLACVEEAIGSYHSDSSPKLQLHSDPEELEEILNNNSKLETNIDDVFEDEQLLDNEVIEIYDEDTGRWISVDKSSHEYDIPVEGESERDIFFKRCIRPSTEDLEPEDFLDFSRGVDESPSDGGSPARTSSPVGFANDHPKPTFQLQHKINSAKRIHAEASENLTRQASVEKSPVVLQTAQQPKLLKIQQSDVKSSTKSGKVSQVRSTRHKPIKRLKSKETTFGPEPDTPRKETTFGAEPVQTSVKETSFGAEIPIDAETLKQQVAVEKSPDVLLSVQQQRLQKKQQIDVTSSSTTSGEKIPEQSNRYTSTRHKKCIETTFGIEPEQASTKETTFGPDSQVNADKHRGTQSSSPRTKDSSSPVGENQINGHSSKASTKKQTFSYTSDTVTNKSKIKETKISFNENTKPSTLDIKQSKQHTTIERANPFRINTPEKQQHILVDVQIHNSQQDIHKETCIDDPSITERLETNIDDPITQRDNPFRESALTEDKQLEDKKSHRHRSRETLIDDPPGKISHISNPKIEYQKVEKPLRSNYIFDDRNPLIQIPVSGNEQSKETLIDEPTTIISSPIVLSPTITCPTLSFVTSEKHSPNTKEFCSSNQVPTEETSSTGINGHSVIAQSPLVKTPTIKSTPVVHLSKSKETLIDDPVSIPEPVPSIYVRNTAKETFIGEPALILNSPVKSPTIKFSSVRSHETVVDNSRPNVISDQRCKETSIDDFVSEKKQGSHKETLIDEPSIILEQSPSINPPASRKYIETPIDDFVSEIKQDNYKETLIDEPSIILEQSPSVNPPASRTYIETSIDDPRFIVHESYKHKAPVTENIIDTIKSTSEKAPSSVTETSIDWPAIKLPSAVTETYIGNTTIVQARSAIQLPPIETVIDEPIGIRTAVADATIDIPIIKNNSAQSQIVDNAHVEQHTQTFIETLIDDPCETSPECLETAIDDISVDPQSAEENAQEQILTDESPRSSLTSTSYSTSSIDTGPRVQIYENHLNRGFICNGPASPNSHQSDIDDHNVTNPTSPEITSSEDCNNSYDSYEVGSQAEDSSLESATNETTRKPRSIRQIKRKNAQNRAYRSALESGVHLTSAQLSTHTNREDIIASRRRFLSEGNLSKSEQSERQKQLFTDYKKYLLSPIPKIGIFKPNNRYRSKSSFSSIERIHHITDLYASRIDSDDSFHKPHIHELHENCILSPEGRREIHDKTLSIDQLNENLRQFDSDTSFGETDRDRWGTSETFAETDTDISLYLQQPSDRTVSMTDLRSERMSRKTPSRRFAGRHLAPKSKSLQTLETNIDDEDDVFPGDTISRTPSVNELRVTKSLQKLNLPDWYKHSNLSKSASTILRRDSTSTMSSFGYSAFSPSIISSPCPSVTSQSGNVVIKTRVTPSASSRIFRKYTPATPAQEAYRRSVLENKSKSTPNFRLPSDKFREKEKPKGLMPVPILSFRQLRSMFEAKAANAMAEKKQQEIKPNSPEMIKKEAVSVPTVTFSDDESENTRIEETVYHPSSNLSITQKDAPTIQSATKCMPDTAPVNTSFERRLPKPILKITEHFSRFSKSKTETSPSRVKSPERKEAVLPASNVAVEATISIPESTVIKRPDTSKTELKRAPQTNNRPEPPPRSFDSTTLTPESHPPPLPPSDNVSRNNTKTPPSVNHDKPAAIRLGNSNNQSHKIQPVPSTSIFARAKASFTSGRSVKETTV